MISDILYSFTGMKHIIPAAIMCFIPVHNCLKISYKVLYPITFATLTAVCSLFTIFEMSLFNGSEIELNFIFIAFVLLLFPLYCMVTQDSECKFSKLFFFFTFVMALYSFFGLLNVYVEIYFQSLGIKNSYMIGFGTEWVVSFLFLVLSFTHFKNKAEWLYLNFNAKKVWHVIWIVPIAVLLTNIMLMPHDYNTMLVGRVLKCAAVVESTLFLLFCLFIILMYLIAKSITEQYETLRKDTAVLPDSAIAEKRFIQM